MACQFVIEIKWNAANTTNGSKPVAHIKIERPI